MIFDLIRHLVAAIIVAFILYLFLCLPVFEPQWRELSRLPSYGEMR